MFYLKLYSGIFMAVNLTAGNHDLMLVNPARFADGVSITGYFFRFPYLIGSFEPL
jgi:hypothetical protein